MRKAILALALASIGSCKGVAPCEDRIGAFVMAQEFVKDALKAPSTAEFPTIADDGVSSIPITLPDGRCAFDVRLYVDSQNSFGAQLRSTFHVTVAPDGDGVHWKLIKIEA